MQLHEPTISMYFFTTGDTRGVEICIEDGSSGLVVLRVTLTPDQFFKMMSKLGHVPCKAGLSRDERIGMQAEVKTVFVASEDNPDDKAIEKALAPFEVDGWKGRRRNMKNWHNHMHGEGGYSVVFDRWVPREEADHE